MLKGTRTYSWVGLAVVILLVLSVVFCISCNVYHEEVDRYTAACEITNITATDDSTAGRTDYVMGFRCEKHSGVIEITAEQYGKYAVGETVTIEITEKKTAYGLEYNYEIMG